MAASIATLVIGLTSYGRDQAGAYVLPADYAEAAVIHSFAAVMSP